MCFDTIDIYLVTPKKDYLWKGCIVNTNIFLCSFKMQPRASVCFEEFMKVTFPDFG